MTCCTRSLFAATLLTGSLLLGTTVVSAGLAFAQPIQVSDAEAAAPEDVAVVEAAPVPAPSPYYGPGWSGPVKHAPPPVCPVWYSPHTSCVDADATGELVSSAP